MSRKEIFHRCRVVAHRDLGANIHLLSLELPFAEYPLPGTFIHIKVGFGTDPLLRRPFSLFDYDQSQGVVDILYKVFGRGTAQLARVRVGETLDVLGPLGNSFIAAESERELVLVGGGVGIPPLYLLSKRCSQNRAPMPKTTFLCGLASAAERVMAERLESLPLDTRFSTDDGSLGHHGLVTDLLEQRLSEEAGTNRPLVCACGPESMLRAVQQICATHKVRCLVSLESIMPCGVGTCLGCVVRKAREDGYFRVCREGPVFPAEEVLL